MQNYDELNELLVTSGVGFHAAECHGFLCALICGNGQVLEQTIKDYFLLDGGEVINSRDCFKVLQALAKDIEAKMYSSDIELELLLADENGSVAERSRSLAEWCQGFMSGLGLSGVKQEKISSDSKELVSDFYNIARLDADILDIGNNDNSEKADDFALMEITEYVRMGAIFIFEDLQGNADNPENYQPEVLH